jgi:hypothetical protein
MDAHKARELSALVAWLQTFKAFPELQVTDKNINELLSQMDVTR